ncbi:MAG: hypothetical protein Q7T86_06170 [Hyphomicrobiaceae bacterium]|nr:hypothetical protein [Hyphomicrobiaceae bacterium]
MPFKSPLIAASVVALSLSMSAGTASAECKTMGFTVNDYGKDGPTKDSKELLDKDIAKWAADNGVEKYTVGKKTVKCELFLDVILFDEHTCTATASVCWGSGIGSNTPKTAKEGAAPKKSATKAAASESKPPVETGAITQESPGEAKSETAAPAASVKPAEAATAPDATRSSASDESAAERAAAAAERAAAAAERAAAAAEKAAAGNKSASADEPAEGIPKP